MLAVADLAPAQDPLGVVGEPVRPVVHGPDAGLVDPAAQVGRRRDVGAAGDDTRGGFRRVAGSGRPAAGRAWPGWTGVCGGRGPSARGIVDRPVAWRTTGARRSCRARRAQVVFGAAGRRNGGHGSASVDAGSVPPGRCIWASVSRAEWLFGCPSVGSPLPLMVYAKTTVGRRVSTAAEGVDEQARGRGRRDRGPRRRGRSTGRLVHQLLAVARLSVSPRIRVGDVRRSARSIRWYSSLGICSSRRAQLLRRPGAANSPADPPTPFQGDHLPAGCAEHALQAWRSGCPAPPGQGTAGSGRPPTAARRAGRPTGRRRPPRWRPRRARRRRAG